MSEGLGYGVSILIGAVFGSFYNVVIHRLPEGEDIWLGRSRCPNCKKTIKPVDLFPVLSWILLKGRCRYCKTAISARYIVVEALCAGLFALAYAVAGWSLSGIFLAALWSYLLITAFIDWRHLVIFDSVNLVFTGLAALLLLLTRADLWNHARGALYCFMAYAGVYALGRVLFRKEAFGFGDVLVAAVIGWYLGPALGLLACLLAFYGAGFWLLGLKLLGHTLKRGMQLPFAPFICLAAFLSSLAGEAWISWYMQSFLV